MGRRQDMLMFQHAVTSGWDIPEEVRTNTVQMMADMVAGKIPASARERIRAAECLAKIDQLNIAREGQDKAKQLNISVIPPAYEQMTGEANQQMVSYLQRVASIEEGAVLPEAGDPEDGDPADQ